MLPPEGLLLTWWALPPGMGSRGGPRVPSCPPRPPQTPPLLGTSRGLTATAQSRSHAAHSRSEHASIAEVLGWARAAPHLSAQNAHRCLGLGRGTAWSLAHGTEPDTALPATACTPRPSRTQPPASSSTPSAGRNANRLPSQPGAADLTAGNTPAKTSDRTACQKSRHAGDPQTRTCGRQMTLACVVGGDSRARGGFTVARTSGS